MRLTIHTDYAFRMLTYVALKEGERSTIREIAEAYGISRNHLMKVAHELQRHGYLNTSRGKGGGLTLARAPAQIGLGDVVRHMEPDLFMAECFGKDNQCVITPHCGLKNILNESLHAFLSHLDGYSLADVTGSRTEELVRDLKLVR